MKKSRLEAFSDGVIAIIITIMVLELKIPHGADLSAIQPLLPVFLSYVLSFIYLGIYWNNHHHLLLATEKVNGKILWANLHLLFWLSLIPFTRVGWAKITLHRLTNSMFPTGIYLKLPMQVNCGQCSELFRKPPALDWQYPDF